MCAIFYLGIGVSSIFMCRFRSCCENRPRTFIIEQRATAELQFSALRVRETMNTSESRCDLFFSPIHAHRYAPRPPKVLFNHFSLLARLYQNSTSFPVSNSRKKTILSGPSHRFTKKERDSKYPTI